VAGTIRGAWRPGTSLASPLTLPALGTRKGDRNCLLFLFNPRISPYSCLTPPINLSPLFVYARANSQTGPQEVMTCNGPRHFSILHNR